MNKPLVIQKPAASGNYDMGRRNRISRITFHHIVGDAPAAISRFQTPGVEVSSQYVIGSDGTIYQCVDENNTAFCDGNEDSNSRTISIEHAGGIASVPYTDAMYAASTRLVAYLIEKYGISDFKRHKDVIDTNYYPGGTSCCGELDVERITANAAKLLMEEGNMSPGTVENVYLAGFRRPADKSEHVRWDGTDMGGPDDPDPNKKSLFYAGIKPQFEYLWDEIYRRDKIIADLQKTNCTPEERQLLDLLKKIGG